ncbi:hypothetical protein P5673_006704 [Acropora cervicornis]|uniref:Uncharacterized protein n=1 Tax=Acropora cervicornis TaxID=6130 RepID=A0AAD9QWJ2_ACRCE|nr:hypothetical protein P5673_006704 [Acropora cervicornis]
MGLKLGKCSLSSEGFFSFGIKTPCLNFAGTTASSKDRFTVATITDVRKAIDVLNEYTGSGASKTSHVNGLCKRKVSEAKGEGKSGQAGLKHKKLEDPFPPRRRSPRFIQPHLHASAINGKV